MLPDSNEGPVLALLPAVDCRFKVKPVNPFKPLTAEVAPLSLTTLSQSPTLLPTDSFQTPLQQQHHLILPSPPVCTMLPPLPPVTTGILPFRPNLSPVAVVPLETPHCTLLKLTPKLAIQPMPEPSLLTSELSTIATSNGPELLQLLPPSENSKDGIPDLNTTPIYVIGHSKSDNIQVYVRRSPRIQKAYNGEHISTVERASRRIAATSPTSSCGSTSSSGSRRCGRAKARKIEIVAPLPIKMKPKPTPKSKIRELAELCGIKTAGIFKEAACMDQTALPAAGTSTNE